MHNKQTLFFDYLNSFQIKKIFKCLFIMFDFEIIIILVASFSQLLKNKNVKKIYNSNLVILFFNLIYEFI